MNVLTICLTEAGRALAARLPYAAHHGDLKATVGECWADIDGFVLIASVGIAVRVVAPLLGSKATDPAVVCVDDTGRFAVPVCGGHAGGANALAGEVAALLGAQAVLTTATDARGTPALDQLPGFVARGAVAAVTRALLDGAPLSVHNPLGWPLPPALAVPRAKSAPEWPSEGQNYASLGPGGPGDVVVVTDEVVTSERLRHIVVLHPPSLVLGVGCSTDATAEDARAAVADVLAAAGLAPESVGAVATIDRRADHPAPNAVTTERLRTFPPDELGAVAVPNPSAVVAAEVGTPSVCEAAALLAAGPGAELIVEKHRTARVTVAVARRRQPIGCLSVVGLGPGDAEHRTPAAARAVRHAQVVVGFGDYIDLCADLLSAGQHILRSPIGDEIQRADAALAFAAQGFRTALVCSGDAGVYALATLALERAGHHGIDPAAVEIVPGVTAALTASAVLGAPVAHDHAAISLSDLLTPWPDIERRVQAAAEADLVVSFYNPRSLKRTWQLEKACSILSSHRPPSTPVGVVTDAGRPAQHVTVTTLADLDVSIVGMRSIVIVGSSLTKIIGGRIVTPRGYHT